MMIRVLNHIEKSMLKSLLYKPDFFYMTLDWLAAVSAF